MQSAKAMPGKTRWQVLRFACPGQEPQRATRQWQHYAPALAALLAIHASALHDAASAPGGVSTLLDNCASTRPYLWLALEEGRAIACASLSAVQPGKEATLHGALHPAARKHPLAQVLWQCVLTCARTEGLALQRLIAEFDSDNRGAKGFCLRHGFQKGVAPEALVIRPDGSLIAQERWILPLG